tara:strand:- start:106 stop:288 length:183 start_codon:yes stop_codon:yes gene_type:complete
MEEHFYQCPYCWEAVSILVDVSQSDQNYIEDCEVCCNPIEFKIECSSQTVLHFEAQNIEQ